MAKEHHLIYAESDSFALEQSFMRFTFPALAAFAILAFSSPSFAQSIAHPEVLPGTICACAKRLFGLQSIQGRCSWNETIHGPRIRACAVRFSQYIFERRAMQATRPQMPR
mgnify:CR=1 FL=1